MKVVFSKMIVNGPCKNMIVDNEVIRCPNYDHAKQMLNQMMIKILKKEVVEAFGNWNYIITDARIEESAEWNPRKF
jgi:hypothetical protein